MRKKKIKNPPPKRRIENVNNIGGIFWNLYWIIHFRSFILYMAVNDHCWSICVNFVLKSTRYKLAETWIIYNQVVYGVTTYEKETNRTKIPSNWYLLLKCFALYLTLIKLKSFSRFFLRILFLFSFICFCFFFFGWIHCISE